MEEGSLLKKLETLPAGVLSPVDRAVIQRVQALFEQSAGEDAVAYMRRLGYSPGESVRVLQEATGSLDKAKIAVHSSDTWADVFPLAERPRRRLAELARRLVPEMQAPVVADRLAEERASYKPD